MSTFSVRFLGCKVSQADAALVRDALLDAGHREAPPDAAEVHVVNTCALTLEAERKSRRQGYRSARAGRRTFLSGCAANLRGDALAGPNVTVVTGSADRVAQEVVEALGGPAEPGCHDAPRLPGRTRAFLKVQNGCDDACSFCIIPTTRGPAESRGREAILRDARRRLAEGHPELVLTGINIGVFAGPGGSDLADLVREVGELPGLVRLRVSSIEPATVGDRLLAAMRETPTVAPHLHIPLQSGDDRVLAAMGRRYRSAGYRDACARAREALPGLNLTTDAIVGFPGEDDAAFAATLAVVEEIGMGKVHVFPYSPRPGTRAAALADQVPPGVRRARAAALRDASDRMGLARRRSRAGSRDVVIVETVHDDGTRSGYAADYTRVVLPPGAEGPGVAVAVAIAGPAGDHLDGRPLTSTPEPALAR